MTSSVLYRWAGYANVVGGILIAIGQWMHPARQPANVATTAWVTAHVFILLAILFGIPGLFGVYARQAQQAKAAGFLGFALLLIALVGFAGIVYYEAFINPALTNEAPAFVERTLQGQFPRALMMVLLVTQLAYSVGWLFFGIATARAGVLPATAAWIALVGGVVLGFAPFLPEIVGKLAATVHGVGLVYLGTALASARPAAAPMPA